MQSKIEQQVMASVAVIYVTRLLTSRTALKLYVLFLAAIGSIFFISLPHVFANFTAAAGRGFPNLFDYTLVAVTETKLVVQLALLVGLGIFASLFLDLARTRATSSFAA